jgi:hypothetical protein
MAKQPLLIHIESGSTACQGCEHRHRDEDDDGHACAIFGELKTIALPGSHYLVDGGAERHDGCLEAERLAAQSQPAASCKDCDNWERREGKAHGACRAIWYIDNLSSEPEDEAFIESACREEAGELLTNPDFWCKFFEPKETAGD